MLTQYEVLDAFLGYVIYIAFKVLPSRGWQEIEVVPYKHGKSQKHDSIAFPVVWFHSMIFGE